MFQFGFLVYHSEEFACHAGVRTIPAWMLQNYVIGLFSDSTKVLIFSVVVKGSNMLNMEIERRRPVEYGELQGRTLVSLLFLFFLITILQNVLLKLNFP